MISIAAVIVLIILDQISKYVIVKNIPLYDSIVVIKDFFNITYVQNTGAGFSILQNQTLFLSFVSFIASIIVIYLYIKEDKKLNKIAYILILAGAIGNLIDRVRLQYVIDFLDFYIFGYNFPVFNLADSYITIGAALIILSAFMDKKNA